jgi:hypothetical protein
MGISNIIGNLPSAAELASKFPSQSLSVSIPSSVFKSISKMNNLPGLSSLSTALENVNAVNTLRDAGAGVASVSSSMSGVTSAVTNAANLAATTPTGTRDEQKAHLTSLLSSINGANAQAASAAGTLNTGIDGLKGTGKFAMMGAATSMADAHSSMSTATATMSGASSTVSGMIATLDSGGTPNYSALSSVASDLSTANTHLSASTTKMASAASAIDMADPKVNTTAAMDAIKSCVSMTQMGSGVSLPAAMTVVALKQSNQLDAVKKELAAPTNVLPDVTPAVKTADKDPVKDPTPAIEDWKKAVTEAYDYANANVSTITGTDSATIATQYSSLTAPCRRVRESYPSIATAYNDNSVLSTCQAWIAETQMREKLREKVKSMIAPAHTITLLSNGDIQVSSI